MNTPNGKQFQCRVCGAYTFAEVTTVEVVFDVDHTDIRNPIDVQKGRLITGYACETCSTMFEDPDKFTKE